MNRSAAFIVAILIGLITGLIFGWVIYPVKYANTSIPDLRADYKADFVLMAAEAYQSDKDLELASHRLSLLDGGTPTEIVQQTYQTVQQSGYDPADLDVMQSLLDALQGQVGGMP
jgi:hypothetical protein